MLVFIVVPASAIFSIRYEIEKLDELKNKKRQCAWLLGNWCQVLAALLKKIQNIEEKGPKNSTHPIQKMKFLTKN